MSVLLESNNQRRGEILRWVTLVVSQAGREIIFAHAYNLGRCSQLTSDPRLNGKHGHISSFKCSFKINSWIICIANNIITQQVF